MGRGRYGGGEWRGGPPKAETGLPEAQLSGEWCEGAAGLGKFGQTSRSSPGRAPGFARADETQVFWFEPRVEEEAETPCAALGRGGRSEPGLRPHLGCGVR